jgi:two-component system response regulator AtoC
MDQDFPEISKRTGTAPPIGGLGWAIEGVSPAIQNVARVIRELAHSDLPVLLTGEVGCGKRAAAEQIHLLSSRSGKSFQVIEAGAVTPAVLTQGFAEGSLLLDEITNLTEGAQKALLDRISARSGNGHDGTNLARLICTSAGDLEGDVRAGRFREDLYYRISAVSLRIPPVRQRKEDIPRLVDLYFAQYAAEFGRSVPRLRPETRQFFQDYAWPGNLRELADAAKAIVALGDDALAMRGLRSLLARSEKGNGGLKMSLKDAAKAASREAEKELILRVLTRTRWNRRRAAKELQISYKALLYKLKQIGYGEYEAS